MGKVKEQKQKNAQRQEVLGRLAEVEQVNKELMIQVKTLVQAHRDISVLIDALDVVTQVVERQEKTNQDLITRVESLERMRREAAVDASALRNRVTELEQRNGQVSDSFPTKVIERNTESWPAREDVT
jgi:hypothetical protein